MPGEIKKQGSSWSENENECQGFIEASQSRRRRWCRYSSRVPFRELCRTAKCDPNLSVFIGFVLGPLGRRSGRVGGKRGNEYRWPVDSDCRIF